MPIATAEKVLRFRKLHEGPGAFLIANAWDAGSARILAGLGFQALATTSSGFAWSTGHADNTLPREAILAHLRDMVQATDLPVNADFENGFGDDPAGVAESVKLAVATGVAGLSIEDATGDPAGALFPIDIAVQRLARMANAIGCHGRRVTSRRVSIALSRSRTIARRAP